MPDIMTSIIKVGVKLSKSLLILLAMVTRAEIKLLQLYLDCLNEVFRLSEAKVEWNIRQFDRRC